MGFVVVSLLSVCVLATLAIACTVCLTVSVVPLGPAVRVVQDVCTVRASTILVNFCFSLVSGIPFNAALSTLGVPVSRLVVNTLDAFRVFSLQLSIQLLSFAEIYGPGTPLQYCVLGKGIGCGPRGHALNKLSGRLVDYAQAWFFFGIRARFISPASASSLIWIILAPSLILFLLVSLWILFSFEAPLDDNDLRLISTLNSIINRAFKKLSAYSRRLRLTLSSSAAVLLAVGVLWPTSILRALCYNIPISRRTAYLEGSAAGIRCDRNSFYDFYKRLGYLLLATTLRSLSLCVATLIAVVFVAYVCLFLHAIWNAYFIRKAIAACPLCHPAVEQVQSIADSNTDLDAVLTISYPRIKAVDIHPRFPENYYIHAEFTQKYELGSVLGEGGHGFVIQARRRSDGQQVAVKFVLKGERAQYWDEHPKYGRVSKDVIIMDLARHENIIALLDVFNDDTYLYIVQEVFGDVWHPAQDTPHGEIFPNGSRCLLGFIFHHEPLCSEHALYIFYQLVDAVAYLHSLGISHCDIKPENILIDSNLKIKLIDFGSCLRIPTDIIPGSARVVYRNSDRFCGTRTYMPPELHLGKQFEAEAADVWAMGIVLFFLLAGYPPFWTIDDIKARHIRFPDIMEPVYWESIIPQWYILGSCFRGNPRYRPTAAELQMREGFMPVAWARQEVFGKTISCCVHMQDNGSTSQ